MVTFISKKGCHTSSSTRGIVIGAFSKGKDFQLIILLVIARDVEVLFYGLIKSFGLTVALWVISRSEVNLHVEG